MARKSKRSGASGAALLALAVASLLSLPMFAQTPSIQSQDSNVAGLVAEITQCARADGVLSVRMRLRNTTGSEIRVDLVDQNNYDAYYVVAASKKYFILRDSEKKPLAPASDGGSVSISIARGASYVWWAKYPAPPAEVKKLGYYTAVTPPFDNVPITD